MAANRTTYSFVLIPRRYVLRSGNETCTNTCTISMSRPTSGLFHKVISLCKRRGFIFEVPGEGERTYDYGPLGAELKSNIINEWRHAVVTCTGNVYAVDSGILTPQRILEASSADPSKQNKDDLYCAVSTDMSAANSRENHTEQHLPRQLFLRPDITQGALIHFLECAKSMGLKLPFGITEVGKVFRNESLKQHPIFTKQEFEQAALQFFCAPSEHRQWYYHWQKRRLQWWKQFACHPDSFSLHEAVQSDLTDLATQHSNIQFNFPWGSHDVETITNRADNNLRRLSEVLEHSSSSLKRAKVNNEKTFPSMISLTAGIDRSMLAYLCDAYTEEERPHGSKSNFRISSVLKLHTCLAPYKVAVLPIQEGDQDLCMYCRTLAGELRHRGIQTTYSDVGSYEYRLAVLAFSRQDEIGTPYRIIADESTLKTGVISLQHRDTTVEEPINGQDVLHSVQRMLLGARLE